MNLRYSKLYSRCAGTHRTSFSIIQHLLVLYLSNEPNLTPGLLQSSPQTELRLKRMLIGLPDQPGSDQWEDERNPGDDDSGHVSSKHSGSSPQGKGGPKRKH